MNTNAASITPRELRATLWSFRREFLIVGLLSLLANALMLTPTLYMLQVFDRVMVSMNSLTLIAVSLLTLALLGVMAVAEWMRSRALVQAGLRLDAVLGKRVFHASYAAHLDAADAQPARSFSDLIAVRQYLTGTGIIALFDVPWSPVYIAALFVLHPWLGVLALVFTAVQATLAWIGYQRAVTPTEQAGLSQQEAHAFLQNKLANAQVIEALGMQPALLARWRGHARQARDLHDEAVQRTHRATAFSKFVRYSQQSLALGAAALLVIEGELTIGGMIAANVLTARALAPIDLLVSGWVGFSSARLAFRRLESLLESHPPRHSQRDNVRPMGRLALRDVTALAPGRADPILKSVSLDLTPGTVTAVLGPSGAGKSTLARAMLGIWPQVCGQVLLDGQPLQDWSREALGPHVGYLPQEVELFEGTIAENIARFSKVEPAEVIRAAEAAGLHQAILRLPRGYDTPMGEAGSQLSGGQRQRVALARAILGEPRLVVLDEPNSHLDDAGERALVQCLRRLRERGCTVVLISHRPGVLQACDRVVMLRDGRVVGDGPREEVLRDRPGTLKASSAPPRPTPIVPVPSP